MVSVANSPVERIRAADPPLPASAVRLAWRDLADGFGKVWMWSALALQDIKLRYRGSMLGPFWLTISTLMMVAGMGLIYAKLFHIDIEAYLPYLTLGLIIWQLLSSTITEGCDTFVREAHIIQQVPIPFSVHVYRNVCRNLLVFAHNLLIIPIGFVALSIPLDWRMLEAIPGLLLLAVNGVWLSFLLGLVSARFRDVPPIVASLLQVLFFVTPIIWPAQSLGEWQVLAVWNPLFAAIDVVRSPLIGAQTEETSWILLIAMTVAGGALAFALFARFRTRIAYWV